MLSVVRTDLLLRKKPEEFELAKAKGLESGIICILDDLVASRFSFSINASENISLGNRLNGLTKNHCLDWFEQTRDDIALIKLLEKDKSMFALETLAILYMRNGFRSKCSEALNVILSRRPDLFDDLNRWANQKGLYFEYDA